MSCAVSGSSIMDRIKYFAKVLYTDRVVQVSLTTCLTTAFCLFYFYGILSGLSTLLAYICGFISFRYIFDYREELRLAVSAAAKTIRSNREKQATCNVTCHACGDKDCKREKIVQKHKPWQGLLINRQVDQALESLLDKTLNEFVCSWYKNVSVDDSFPAQIRYNIRFSISILLNKLFKVNYGEFVGHKVLPVILRHIELCESSNERDGKVLYHPACYNRAAEMEYLRLRVKQILPYIIDKPQLHCTVLSSLIVEILSGWLLLPLSSVADPAVPNSLLLLLLNQTYSSSHSSALEEKVELLANFANKSSGLQSNSALMADMCSMMKDRSLLCWFMQFLKDRGSLHILQFVLDVEEFNRRMLSPDLESEELDTLYRDAWDLYSVYFSPHSPDNIGLSSDLVLQMRKVLSKDVTKLRTSPPLFQAYEHAYSLLDNIYCPLFHTSDEFYMWLCGPRTPLSHSRSGSRRVKKNEGAVGKLSNKVQKIRGALGAATLDGQPYDAAHSALPLEPAAEYGEELSEEDIERDMSCWKIKIISTDNKSESKQQTIFTIQVEAWAPEGVHREKWTIERRISDFYSLEAKLSEFHGEFIENKLPSSGILSTIPTQPQIYEAYIEKLLLNPTLRGSEMLHWFLTSPVEHLSYMEENAFNKLLKRSVGTLKKERGQNLDTFIQTYIQSTESKQKNKLDFVGSYEVSPRRKRILTNSVFKDNLSLPLDLFASTAYGETCIRVAAITTPTQAVLYIGSKIMKLPDFLMKLSLCFVELLKNQVDRFICNYIDRKIQYLLSPLKLSHLIHLIQWVVFEKKNKTDSMEVLHQLQSKLSNMKYSYTRNIYTAVFNFTQDPMLNKHLFYVLLDLCLEELFPDLDSHSGVV